MSKQTIILTESELKEMIHSTVTTILNEISVSTLGMRDAAMANLSKKIALGHKTRRLANGKIEDQEERFRSRFPKMIEELNAKFSEDFIDDTGESKLILSCIANHFDKPLYSFTFKVHGIESINTTGFVVFGEINIDDINTIQPTLVKAVLPPSLKNAKLVYNFSSGIISYPIKKKGLIIKPFVDNNRSWFKLLDFTTNYFRGFRKIAR